MRTAKELEAKYTRTTVRLVADGNSGTGVLALAGPKTELKLTTKEMITERDLDTGWFDLVLEDNNGRKILLHNALSHSTGMPLGGQRDWEFSIFPNIVVIDAASILPSGYVREISFTCQGLEDIFYYDIAEWHSLYKAPPDVVKQVRELRQLKQYYPRKYPFFSPSDIYLIHDLPRVLRERVGDRTYEIYLGHSESKSRQRLAIEAVAIASIRFSKPITLDDALDAAWCWRRFFQQITMQQLPFLTLSCRGSTKRRDRPGDLYLSNMETPTPRETRDMLSFSPRDVPYGQWKHRKKFAAVMRRWLEYDDRRRLFRARLDRVLEGMREVSSTKLVADLCSAIESLTELRAPSSLADVDLESMVDAAAVAGANASPPVSRERIHGLLSLLRHQSLPQRLKLLAAAIESDVPKKDAQTVIKIARELRTFEAHGDHWDDMTVPLVSPTLEMLASMCVLWDLTTSGMPSSFDDRRLSASSRAHWAAQDLRRKQTRASPSALDQ